MIELEVTKRGYTPPWSEIDRASAIEWATKEALKELGPKVLGAIYARGQRWEVEVVSRVWADESCTQVTLTARVCNPS